MTDYEEVEHTADLALRVHGADLAGLLANAARGMNSLLAPGWQSAPLDHTRTIEVEALDREGLLVDWLSELLYWAEVGNLIWREFRFDKVAPTHLRATCRGGRVPELVRHIKAVTYHNLAVVQTGHGLEATVVFDV
jgi:SHS2 domain-containing protein